MKKWKDIKHKKAVTADSQYNKDVSFVDIDDLFVEDEANTADLKEQINNLEISLDMIKSLANLGTYSENVPTDELNLFFAIRKLCEVGSM